MSTFSGAAAGLFLLATAWVLWRMRPFVELLAGSPGPRTRRRIVGRGFRAIGVWQWTLGLLMLSMSQWTAAPALLIVGTWMFAAGRWPWLVGA